MGAAGANTWAVCLLLVLGATQVGPVTLLSKEVIKVQEVGVKIKLDDWLAPPLETSCESVYRKIWLQEGYVA